jgi:hypothetical protein
MWAGGTEHLAQLCRSRAATRPARTSSGDRDFDAIEQSPRGRVLGGENCQAQCHDEQPWSWKDEQDDANDQQQDADQGNDRAAKPDGCILHAAHAVQTV